MNFEQTVETLITLPRNHSVLIVGKHGIGKSDAVREAAHRLGIPCVDQRLSQCDVGDIKGMPFCIGGRTFFAPPDWFPLRDEDAQELQVKLNLANTIKYAQEGILFLDEIDRAVREVQQAGFELVLDHRLNMRYLPDLWRVVSAVNQDGDIYHVNEMDVAFIDRFFVIKFNPSKEEWFAFARKDARIHHAIIEFLMVHDKLMDPTKEVIEASPGEKLYSRRSWEKLSQCILNQEKMVEAGKAKYSLLTKTDESLAMLNMIAQGYLGTTTGTAFRNFVETDYESLNGNTILNEWSQAVEDKLKKLVKDKRTIELGSYSDMIVNYVQDKKIKELNPKQSKNLLKYIQIMPNENVASFWKNFQADCKETAHAWYGGYDKVEVVKRIVSVLANPTTGTAAAKAA
jgi:hypothetical protein